MPFDKVRKNDLIFTLEDQVVQLVIKKTRKLAKLENVETSKITWATRMRFDLIGYYYLEK